MDPSVILWQLGGGTVAGVAVGFALKKTTKLALFLLGLAILAMYGLAQTGIISIHWDVLTGTIESGSRAAGAWVWGLVKGLGASLVGFGTGLVMGFKLA